MYIAKALGMRPKDKHVSEFMEKTIGLATETDGKRAATKVIEMSEIYVWIEERGDVGVKVFLGQFMTTTFSNLLVEARNAGIVGRLLHTYLMSFMEMTHRCGKYNNIACLYDREMNVESRPNEKPVITITQDMIDRAKG